VRVAVLKEEKRMLGLQLKTKSTQRSGTGPDSGDNQSYERLQGSGTTGSFNLGSGQPGDRGDGTGRIKPSRTIGVGDGDVFALDSSSNSNMIQSVSLYKDEVGGTMVGGTMVGGVGAGPIRIHETELNTEQNTEIREKEIHTVFVGGGRAPVTDVIGVGERTLASGGKTGVASKPKVTTRSIGVGAGNVFESADSTMQVG